MERSRITITGITILSQRLISVKFREREEERTLQWESPEAVSAFFKAAEYTVGENALIEGNTFSIPATAVIGSDQVHDVEINWEEEFPWRRELLATWVMMT